MIKSLPSKHKAPDSTHWGENVIKTKDKENRENSNEKQFTAKKRNRGLRKNHSSFLTMREMQAETAPVCFTKSHAIQ